jgi:hypothetical protein
MIRTVTHAGTLIALIVPHDHGADGIEFFTPNEFSQQVAYMNRPQGYEIAPHVHKPVPREVSYTREVLFVRKGRVKVDLYAPDKTYLSSVTLTSGDVILLAEGGHGFTMLEPTEIIEVKQGPYAGTEDKERFTPA